MRGWAQAANTLSKRFEARFAKMPAGGRLKVAAKGSSNGSKRTKAGGSTKSGAADEPPTPTAEDRQRLARHLGRARMEDVTAAVHQIDRRCPTALVLKRARRGDKEPEDGGGSSSSGGGDEYAALTGTGTAAVEIEVDVDELDPWTFCAVERVVGLSSASATRRTKNKRTVVRSAAASSSGGKSRGGFRHRHQHQERGKAGTTAAAGGGAGAKDDQSDRGGPAGTMAGAAAGAAEVRPYKKSKAAAGASCSEEQSLSSPGPRN